MSSDFLKNLRSSHKKEPGNLRKSQDSYFYGSHDRRMNRDRRAGYGDSMDHRSAQMDHRPVQSVPGSRDLMPEILDNLTNLSDQMERLVNTQERIADVKVNHYKAMTEFFNNLNTMLANPPAPGSDGPPRATTSYACGTHYTKDDVLGMIQDMRDQGATFAIIAEYLREKGIPTFSGRGEWHAQTIHRLCKE